MKEMKKRTNVRCPECGHTFMTSGYVRKLTIEDIEEAEKMIATGLSYREVARNFNVHSSSIHERISKLKKLKKINHEY